MLSSINFLFLLSLGFLSWIILCYIQQIEQFVESSTNRRQELAKKEISTMAEPANPQIVTPTIYNHYNYDIYVNFLCIFICIYVLFKIMHLAETYLAKPIPHRIYVPPTQDTNVDPSATFNDFQDQQETLKRKINSLEKQNHNMNCKLKSVVETLSPVATEFDEQMQNIFVSNKHIHLNRKIYVTQSNIEIENEKIPKMGIWEKCLELKSSAPLMSNEKNSYIPTVMSIEELESIKGIF